jgi:putative copper export protein
MHGWDIGGTVLAEVPAPSTPLGPFVDSFVSWTTWATMMGFLGLVALALIAAGPAARKIDIGGAVVTRLARVAVVFGLLGVPAVLTDSAHDASEAGGYDYGAAWGALYDGSFPGLLAGLEITLIVIGVLLVLPLAFGRRSTALLATATGTGALALLTTKFPSEKPDAWGKTIFETFMWFLHLTAGGVWIGGLIGLLALAIPGAVPPDRRAAFWAPAIRRFSIGAMTCVGAITLSGLFLYWEHVDGPRQLFTTMYGRVLGVKILIFGTMVLLGVANQFWLHPRIEALRAAGDTRPVRVILLREFPVTVALEVLLGLSVIMVAPFLHGSARNQAFQAEAAKVAPAGTKAKDLPKAPQKTASASTWAYGTAETALVIVVMAGGYRVSGRLARRRMGAALSSGTPEPALAEA